MVGPAVIRQAHHAARTMHAGEDSPRQ